MKQVHILLFLFLTFFIASQTQAQNQSLPTGPISGRIVGENGQPLPNINVQLLLVGEKSLLSSSRSTFTDEKGKFEFDSLPFSSYQLSVHAPSYVIDEPIFTKTRYFHLGDIVNISMVKGGVITGKVILPNNEPAVRTRVTAIRIADSDGNTTTDPQVGEDLSALTDDRGIYRIYGLLAGKYVVSTNSKTKDLYSVTPYDNDTSIYHPNASSRAKATVVTLQLGTEATGIDIAYRSVRGYSISGKINFQGAKKSKGSNDVEIYLTNTETGFLEDATSTELNSEDNSFGFFGVAQGEYELTAIYGDMNYQSFAGPINVKIKNNDITGLVLPLAKSSTITGKVIQELDPLVTSEKNCPKPSYILSEEIVVSAQAAFIKKENKLPLISLYQTKSTECKEDGSFTVFGLNNGLYHLLVQYIEPSWYLNTISSLPAKDAKTKDAKMTLENYDNGVPVTANSTTNCLVKLTNGAASIQGRVKTENKQQNLVVYLVPVDKRDSENILRYYQTTVDNGSFQFTNLAPGKYWVYAESLKETNTENRTITSKLLKTQTPEGRLALRHKAELTNNQLELSRCQVIKDLELKFNDYGLKVHKIQ